MRERKIPVKIVNTPGGMLSRLKDKLLVSLGIDPTRLGLCVERYAIKSNGGVRNSVSHYTRTNMMKAIQRGELTIFIFFRILQALEIEEVKLTVSVTSKDGKVCTVSESTNEGENGSKGKKAQAKRVNTPGAILDRLKDKLLVALNVDSTRLDLCVERYAVKMNGGVRNSESHSARSAMKKALQRGELTIFIFFRVLQALEVKDVTMSVTVKTKNGEEHTVSETTKKE